MHVLLSQFKDFSKQAIKFEAFSMPLKANSTHLEQQRKGVRCLCTEGTALLPKIPLSTPTALPTMMSSETFSSLLAASPATSAMRTGAWYKFQNRNSSPRFAVVLPTWPNKFVLGSQNTRSKHNTTCRELHNRYLSYG